MLTVKAQLGEDLRRFQLGDGQISWAGLVQELLKRFSLPSTTSLQVCYKDTDNELVHVSSDSELKEALICALQQSSSSLRLEIKIVEPLTSSSPSSSTSQILIPLRSAPSSSPSPSPVQTPVLVEEVPAQETIEVKEVKEEPIPTPEPVVAQKVFEEEEEVSQEPVDSKPAVLKTRHLGIVCDGCKKDIYGVRYKCGHCPDFDLCEECEATEPHFPNHIFIKIKFSLDSCKAPEWYNRSPLLPSVTSLPSRPFFTPNPAFCPVVLQPIQVSFPAPVEVIPTPPERVPIEPTPAPIPEPVKVIEQPVIEKPVEKPVETPSPKPAPASFDAKFVADKSINDGTIIPKGTSFTKTWRMKNTGETKWPMGTRLVFVGGDPMGKLQSFLVVAATASEEVDISVTLSAPAEPGRYISHWRLQTPEGLKFGHRVWCDIVVNKPTEVPAPAPTTPRLPDGPCLMGALPTAVFTADPVTTPSPVSPSSTSTPITTEAVEAVDAFSPSSDERYEVQMKQLLQMGFADRTKNFRLLKKYGGNVQQTINAVLEDADSAYPFRR